MMNGMEVQQDGQTYYVYTPQGIWVGKFFCGADGQIIKDVAALAPITKALAIRWGVIKAK